ncbi:MAG: hypothetical protein IK088_04520, partial [Lachnospiraceae bacterium]|nr:hypothetical protein [Lachnospiraceae bacterium]
MAEQVQKLYSLSGVWQVRADDGILHSIRIPGTLEENSIGHPDTGTSDPHKTKSGSFPKSDTDRFLLNENLLSEDEPAGPQPEPVWTRFTRRHVYEGTVRISRMLEFKEKRGRRYFFEVERARFLQLLIDEEEIPPLCPPTISAPQVFEVTGKIDGSHMMTIVSDNHYAKWPGEEIMNSNAASDDTATNWNGLLGYVRIREELPAFPERLSVRYSGGEIFVKIWVRSLDQTVRRIILSSGAFRNRFEGEYPLESGVNDIEIGPLSPAEKFVPWDVADPKLYEVTALLVDPEAPLTRVSELRIRTGFRTISAEGADLLLNGRKLYLRGEENRSVHPETLYPPMERMAWKRLFMTYRSYGINYFYFRTHVPPEEAFE